jgi:hypothetical protein
MGAYTASRELAFLEIVTNDFMAFARESNVYADNWAACRGAGGERNGPRCRRPIDTLGEFDRGAPLCAQPGRPVLVDELRPGQWRVLRSSYGAGQ